MLGAKWNEVGGLPYLVCCVSGKWIPSSVFVSDPVLKTVPAPNMAPSTVGREGHSCDALNRWVRMAVVRFTSQMVGITHGHVWEMRPTGGSLLWRRAWSWASVPNQITAPHTPGSGRSSQHISSVSSCDHFFAVKQHAQCRLQCSHFGVLVRVCGDTRKHISQRPWTPPGQSDSMNCALAAFWH